ncbi:MAG TPA: VOC family protein [Pyrinomonadaceae bacterium]|nr:VOC family protein [Pyrinomonadaceae bacterium]
MPRVVHFEISVDEPERACRFYNNVFGWQTRKWGESGGGIDASQEYWLIETGDEGERGINGGLYRRHQGMGFTAHVNTIDVPSVDDFIEKVQAHGGRAVTQKMHIPGVGHFAYCEDTEGNTFGILQPEPRATD